MINQCCLKRILVFDSFVNLGAINISFQKITDDFGIYHLKYRKKFYNDQV